MLLIVVPVSPLAEKNSASGTISPAGTINVRTLNYQGVVPSLNANQVISFRVPDETTYSAAKKKALRARSGWNGNGGVSQMPSTTTVMMPGTVTVEPYNVTVTSLTATRTMPPEVTITKTTVATDNSLAFLSVGSAITAVLVVLIGLVALHLKRKKKQVTHKKTGLKPSQSKRSGVDYF